jgi:hypothetical protein
MLTGAHPVDFELNFGHANSDNRKPALSRPKDQRPNFLSRGADEQNLPSEIANSLKNANLIGALSPPSNRGAFPNRDSQH